MQNKLIKRIYYGLHLQPVGGFIRHLFKPTGFLRNFFIFPIGLKFREMGVLSEEDKVLRSIKDSKKGKRIFIIATGPSLRLEDIEKLANEDTIGVNTVFMMYKKTTWRPTYYMMGEYGGLKILNKSGDFDKIEDFAKEKIFLNYLMHKKLKNKKTVFFHYCWLDHYYNYGSLKWKGQSDMVLGCYDYYSITPAAILMAMYMGYKDIYLIGADCNYAGEKLNFDRPEALQKFRFSHDMALKTNFLQYEGYRAVNEVVKRVGANVYNATRGGLLEVFPRVNFDELDFLPKDSD